MKLTLRTPLEILLVKHEGVNPKPYTDTKGKTTIGIGRNLTDNGLTADEILFMFRSDLANAVTELYANFDPWFGNLDTVRQDVLINMAFNIGLPRLKTFKKMITALQQKDYSVAADEMRNSKWAEQVGNRASELAIMMETAQYA